MRMTATTRPSGKWEVWIDADTSYDDIQALYHNRRTPHASEAVTVHRLYFDPVTLMNDAEYDTWAFTYVRMER